MSDTLDDRIPSGLREALDRPMDHGIEGLPVPTWCVKERRRAMAAALRWVGRTMQEDDDIDNLDDLAWTLKRTIAVLEQEAHDAN